MWGSLRRASSTASSGSASICRNESAIPPGNPAILVAAAVGAYHDTKYRSLFPFRDVPEVLDRIARRLPGWERCAIGVSGDAGVVVTTPAGAGRLRRTPTGWQRVD